LKQDKDMQGKEGNRSRLALVATGREDAAEAAPPTADGQTDLLPFAAAPDRYFETAALRDCHARVARAALEGDTVTVIEGERGCGKTTFVRMLQQRVGNSRDLCFIDVRLAQGERYVLDCLARTFCPDPSAGADALLAQLVERSRRRGPCLVVVDDADRLSMFALRRLFTLKQEVEQADGRLGIVVTLSPARLAALLELPSFAAWRQQGLTRVELPRFSAQETADYLHARIQSAGLATAISFEPAQVRRIHQASGGLPRHIKRVAGELLDGIRPRTYRGGGWRKRLARHRHTLIPVALIVVPVICIGLLLQAILQRPGAEVMERLMSTEGIEAAGTAVPVPAAPPAPAASGAVDRAPDDAPPSAPARAAPAVSPPETVAAAPAPVTPAIPSAPKAPAVPAPAAVPAAAPEPKAAEPVRAVAPSLQTAPVAPVPAPAAPPSVEAVAVSPPPRPPVDTARLDGNEWLRAQNPAAYTLQLAGAAERKDVQEFSDKYGLPGKVVIAEVLRGGKVWYMVLYNSYATWGEARRDLGTLPVAIQRNDPFARRFASVQAMAVPAP
jgi:type II secretory pathway predicted ATPase ExeA